MVRQQQEAKKFEMNTRSDNGTSPMPMLCESGETDAGPTCTAAGSALRRRTAEQPGRLAMLPSLGSLHSPTNQSSSSSGSIHILDSSCGVPLQAVGEESKVMGAAATDAAASGVGTTQPPREMWKRAVDAREDAPLVMGPSLPAPRSRPTSTAAATLKLQPSSTSMEQRRSDMNLLRTRRRQWLEDQARQIEIEEHDQHRLGEASQHLSEVAEAAAQTAARYVGSPLPMPGSDHDAPISGSGSSSNEMNSVGYFRRRSISITGINLPSPLSQKFILNMPLPTEEVDASCHHNDAGTQQEIPQIKDEMGLHDVHVVHEPDVEYAIGGGVDVNMEAFPKEGDDDDESTVVMGCSDDESNGIFPEQGIGNAAAKEEPPVFKQYPAINLRRRSDDGLTPHEDIGIPSTRSSDSLFDCMYRRSSADGGPRTGSDNLGEDFALPSRPRSSEPRFAASTHFQGHELRPKMGSEVASTFKSAAPETQVRSTGRILSGPAPPPPPPMCGQADITASVKPPQNNSSSQHLATLMQPLLFDSDGISEGNTEKGGQQLRSVGIETQMEATMGLVTFDGENSGVEVSLPPHLSADGFDSLKYVRSCKVPPDTAEALPSMQPRPANVSTFDRSNSVVDEARGDPFGGSADVAISSANGMARGADAFFTPPQVKTKVTFGTLARGTKGEENAPSSIRNSRAGGGSGLSTSPPLAPPVGWGRPLTLQKQPNTSSFGRSASVGGVYASPEQSASGSHQCRIPGETASQCKTSAESKGSKNFQSSVARSQQCSNQLHAGFRPRLPSLASPTAMEEDH